MVGQYSKFEFAAEFTIPAEFPEVLKNFAREVLRVQPPNIEDFAVKYFERCGTTGADVHGDGKDDNDDRMSLKSVVDSMKDLFKQYDKDDSGYLDHTEFEALICDFLERADLPADQLVRFLGEADMNADGKIEFHEFLPAATKLVETLLAKRQTQADIESMRHNASEYLVHGMTREEFKKTAENLFRRIDEDKSGQLSKAEFTKALHSIELGLTQREMNAVMIKIFPRDSDQVSYEDFMPICFDMLQKMTSMRALENELELDELSTFLMDLFQVRDTEDTGTTHLDDVQILLHEASLGLTRAQIFCIISDSPVSDAGYIKYREFVPRTAMIIKHLTGYHFDAEDLDTENIRGSLMEVFAKLGSEATYDQIEETLTQCGLLNEQELSAVLILACNGHSKLAARDEESLINVLELEEPMMAVIKQTRRLAASNAAANTS